MTFRTYIDPQTLKIVGLRWFETVFKFWPTLTYLLFKKELIGYPPSKVTYLAHMYALCSNNRFLYVQITHETSISKIFKNFHRLTIRPTDRPTNLPLETLSQSLKIYGQTIVTENSGVTQRPKPIPRAPIHVRGPSKLHSLSMMWFCSGPGNLKFILYV